MRYRVNDSMMEQSSYVMENSITTDMEYATINHLFADFNINRDSAFAAKRSPLKMMKIGESTNDDEAYKLHRPENPNERFNTNQLTAQGTLI